MDVVAEGVKGGGDLAAGLVNPLADLGGFVDGDTGSDDDRGGDYEACLQRVVRP